MLGFSQALQDGLVLPGVIAVAPSGRTLYGGVHYQGQDIVPAGPLAGLPRQCPGIPHPRIPEPGCVGPGFSWNRFHRVSGAPGL